MILKRGFDIATSFAGLVLLGPLFLVIAIIIKFTSKGAVFYRQTRVGQYGREFRIHKFRTMIVDADKLGPRITIGSDCRITKVGRFLRQFKIDELPQLIDVLIGDMSIVGPRPEVPEYVKLYQPCLAKIVLSVKPGITDLASIHFKDENLVLATSNNPQHEYIQKILPLKLEMSAAYVNSQSLVLDIKIILKTILAVFHPRCFQRKQAVFYGRKMMSDRDTGGDG